MQLKKTVFLVIRVATAVALIAFVLSRVQLHDRLRFHPEAEKPPITCTVEEETDGLVRYKSVDGGLPGSVRREELAGNRPEYGLLSAIRQLRWKPFGLAALCLIGTYIVGILRWRLLCRARGIRLTAGEATRFTFLGFFFNNAVPGATGGDVIKAYFASKNRASRTEVFASVILDRVIGLTALGFLAAGAILFQSGDPKFGRLSLSIFLLLAATVVVGAVYYSRRLRKVLGLQLIGRLLPFQELFRRVDSAFFDYRYHKQTLMAAFLVSFLAHGFTILNHILIGTALGLDAPIAAYFVYVPIGQVASAIPVLPGGWGVREAAYGYLFRRAGVSFSQGTALSILHAITVLAWSLVGGIFFMIGQERLPEEGIDDLISDAGS